MLILLASFNFSVFIDYIGNNDDCLSGFSRFILFYYNLYSCRILSI